MAPGQPSKKKRSGSQRCTRPDAVATLRDIRTRIGSVKNTQQVTRAMKMVAAAKLRRAQEAIFRTRPYANKIAEMLYHLVHHGDFTEEVHPLFTQRPEVRGALIVVVTGDRGLAGAFNSNIFKRTEQLIASSYRAAQEAGALYILAAGRKGQEYFAKRQYQMVDDFGGVFRSLRFSVAQRIGEIAADGFLAGRWDEVKIVYNEFRNTISQNRIVEPLLPIPADRFLTPVMSAGGIKDANYKEQFVANYLFEPDGRSIFDVLLPREVNYQIWRALLESNAAEQGARMVAMDNATSNANELLRTLRLKYNRARQSAITTEILEIITGANALEDAAT